MQRPILVLGFEPFGGHDINPSQRVVQALADDPARKDIVARVFPVSAREVPALLARTLAEVNPRAVLALGLGRGPAIHLERVGINLCDFDIPDRDGLVLKDEPVVPEGPAAYFSTLPVRQMAEKLTEAKIPNAISYSAGTYLCNLLLYSLLHQLSQSYPDCRGGFVHLPLLPEMTRPESFAPSLPLKEMMRAVRVMLALL